MRRYDLDGFPSQRNLRLILPSLVFWVTNLALPSRRAASRCLWSFLFNLLVSFLWPWSSCPGIFWTNPVSSMAVIRNFLPGSIPTDSFSAGRAGPKGLGNTRLTTSLLGFLVILMTLGWVFSGSRWSVLKLSVGRPLMRIWALPFSGLILRCLMLGSEISRVSFRWGFQPEGLGTPRL